jgi:hypothetical protein
MMRQQNAGVFPPFAPPQTPRDMQIGTWPLSGVIVPWHFFHHVIFIFNKVFTQPFDFVRTRSRLFQKRVVHTKFDILRLYLSFILNSFFFNYLWVKWSFICIAAQGQVPIMMRQQNAGVFPPFAPQQAPRDMQIGTWPLYHSGSS